MTMRCSSAPAGRWFGSRRSSRHGALVAFDVQLDAGGEALFAAVEVVARADDAVARDGQEGATQRVEVRGGRRIGMRFGAQGGVALVLSEGTDRCAGHAMGQVAGCLEVLGNVAADVGVGARVAGLRRPWIARLGEARRAGVVDVVGGLLPGVEDDLLVSVVRVQRGDDALGRVVEQHRADADGCTPNSKPCVALKKGSYCRTGLPLLLKMVQPLPTQRGLHGAAFHQRPGLGLDLLLDLAAEAVGVAES
jgi:hypothetical protein